MNRNVFYSQKKNDNNIPLKRKIETEKKYIHNIHYVNIDSNFRNKIPKNITENQFSYVSKGSLNLIRGENELKINIPQHSFEINDRIIIQNVDTEDKYFNNGLYFINNSNFIIVYWPDHQITDSYLTYHDIFEVIISEVKGIDNNYIYNIPVNILNDIHQIYLLNDDGSIGNFTDTYYLPSSVFTALNIKDNKFFKENYFFIRILINFNSDKDFLYKPMIKLKLKNIAGIPLNEINANYPINYMQKNGYHIITDVGSDYIKLTLNTKAYKSISNFGTNKIIVAKIINTIDGYPNTNSYKIDLTKAFHNVTNIEIVSSEFAYVDYLFKANNNNKIYWQNLEDGKHIYSASIIPGNYDPFTFVKHLQKVMNNVKKISSTVEKVVYNNFNIELNINTHEIKFTSYKTNILVKPFSVSTKIINNQTRYIITIKHKNNIVNKHDKITIANAKLFESIPSTIINTTHEVYEINKMNHTYSILLPLFNSKQINSTTENNAVRITTKNTFRLLFNYSDTIGSLIGFRNVGDYDSITKYNTVISNFDNYYLEGNFSLNEIGETRQQNNFFNFTGKFFYFLMYLNHFEWIITSDNLENAFAKFQLNGHPGDILFNSHVYSPVIFQNPIPQLNELDIKFRYPDGTLVNFNNTEHSFTLKITELIAIPNNSQLNSNMINIYDKNIINTSIEL